MPYPQLEITVKYKCKGKKLPLPIVGTPKDAMSVINTICNKKEILWVEEVLMLCLNSQNRLQSWYRVAKGGNDGVKADIGVIATIAAQSAAFKIILAHNHPSDSTKPSQADIEATRNISKGLALIGRTLIDHIIFTDNEYLSMRDAGYMNY